MRQIKIDIEQLKTSEFAAADTEDGLLVAIDEQLAKFGLEIVLPDEDFGMRVFKIEKIEKVA